MTNKNTEKKFTMVDRVLRYINDTGDITAWEAIQSLGCTRLSEYIRQLREQGYDIQDEWVKARNRYDEEIKYKRYFIPEARQKLDIPF